MITKLIIGNKEQAMVTELPVPLNYKIADIQEPDKVSATFSYAIKLNGTNEINTLFENIFEVNLITNTFNKNKNTDCKYLVDEILIFEGYLQLLKITKQPSGLYVYDCTVKGTNGNLFSDIGDALIIGNTDASKDLDFSEFNHTYTRANQIASYANYATGANYHYGFVNNGTNNGSDVNFAVENFIPMFPIKVYLDKISAKYGYTFDSSFMNSALYKRLYLYPNLFGVKMTQAQIEAKQLYIGKTTDTAVFDNTPYDVAYNNESAPYFDLGNQHGSGADFIQLNSNGYYNVVAKCIIEFSFTHTEPTVTKAYGQYQLFSQIGSTKDYVNYVNRNINQNGYNGGVDTLVNKSEVYTFTNEVASGEIFGSAGEYFWNKIIPVFNIIEYRNASNAVVTTGTGTFTIKLKVGSEMYVLCTQKTIVAGDTLAANNALPINIKQKDLLKAIINAFNLQLEPNKATPKQIACEPFDDFYNDFIDSSYENSIDTDKDIVSNINSLKNKRYLFTYKDDTDAYNDDYKKSFGETYGTHIETVESDFINSDSKTEIVFSPTPMVANVQLGIAQPKIFKIESNQVKPFANNIRLLLASGTKVAPNYYNYSDASAGNSITTNDYSHVGHLDDFNSPTIDLNFGIPRKLYYTYPQAYYTNANLFNMYHKNKIDSITDKDAKFISAFLWVNSLKINQFSFRHRLFIKDAYYIVNAINNYNVLNETSTQYELFKLRKSNVFTPTTTPVSGIEVETDNNSTNHLKANGSVTNGSGVINLGTNCVAIGENIVIQASSFNVTAIGTNISIANGVSNVMAINCNDIEITESNSNYINNVLVYPFNQLTVEVITASTKSLTLNDNVVVCDTSSNNIEIIMPDPATAFVFGVSKEYTIKKYATANTVTIKPFASELVESSSSIVLTKNLTSVVLVTDGVDWYVKANK